MRFRSRKQKRMSRKRFTRKRFARKRSAGGAIEEVLYDCGGGIKCALGENTIVTYRDPGEKYSVPAFVSKKVRNTMNVEDSYP